MMCGSCSVTSSSDTHRFSTLHDTTFRRFSTPDINLRHTRVCFQTRNNRGSIIRIRAKAKAINDGNVNSMSMCLLERMSLYELLGISERCNLGEIKQAYKQLARKYHPDVSPPDRVEEYTERFIRVHEAYETLSDPGTRAMYDCDMARGIHLPFSNGKRDHYSDRKDGMMERSSEWRHRWLTQLQELKIRRIARKEEDQDDQNFTWGARMRRQRNDAGSS